jgi:hypothetical protein
MTAILHRDMPHAPWRRPHRLPGIAPLDPDAWILIDEAYAPQMAERDRLIATMPDAVHALLPGARPAADELLARILTELPRLPGFAIHDGVIERPDGVRVRPAPAEPLLTLGRLLPEDFCLLERPPGSDEHVLTGAILCFPARWRLAEKIGRPLIAIHDPVPAYDDGLAPRVQRLFDGIRPETPLWRSNVLLYANPALYQPERAAPGTPEAALAPRYLRSERQCLIRLPQTGAVVFSIRTYLMALEDLPEGAAEGVAAVSP